MAAAASSSRGDATQNINVDDVVWCKVDSSWPEWPCKVLDLNEFTIDIQSFGDNQKYTEMPLKNVISFTEVEKTMSFIAKGRKKFKNRSSNLDLFNKSLTEAMVAVKTKNPEFLLEDDTVTSMMNKPMECSPIISATGPDATNGTSKSRFGRTVKKLSTPTEQSSSKQSSTKQKPRLKRKKNDREGSVGADPSSQGSDPDSPTLINNLLQQSINRLSAKRKRNVSDTMSPISSAKKCCSENSDTADLPVSPQPSLDNNRIAVNLSDELLCSSPSTSHKEKHVNTVVKESSIMSDALADTTPSPLSLSKDTNSNDEDDELLPATYDLRNTKLKFSDLKQNDVIWVKYGRHPHWPSIVTSIQIKKTKKQPSKPQTKIMVYFLGVVDDTKKPFTITREVNIASYSYFNKQRLIDLGREKLKGNPYAEQFDQAVKEADELKKMRYNNEISGSPKQQITLLVEKRQSFIKHFLSDKVSHSQVCTTERYKNEADNDDLPPSFSAFGFDVQRDLFSNDDDSDDEWIEQSVTEDGEDKNSPYNFKNISSYLEENKSLLVDISTGKVHSELHNIFNKGSLKERGRLKLTNKSGPAELSKTEETDVLTIIQEAVKGTFDGMNFSYAYDVLLPEIMMRMISQQESCSLEEAKEMFYN